MSLYGMIKELKEANDEVNKQRSLVEQEMVDQGNKGNLWQNSMCKAWSDYEAAIVTQENLREKYGI